MAGSTIYLPHGPHTSYITTAHNAHHLSTIGPPTNKAQSTYQKVLKKHTTLLLISAIVFEISVLTVTVVIVLGAVYAHQHDGRRHNMTCIVVVGMFGFVGVIGSAAHVWLLWKRRSRFLQLSSAEEEVKERREVRRAAGANLEDSGRSLSRGRPKQRELPRGQQHAPSVSSGTAETRKSKISSWTHHLDLEDSSSEERAEARSEKEAARLEGTMSPAQRVIHTLSQEIIEHVSRSKPHLHEVSETSLTHNLQSTSPRDRCLQESSAQGSISTSSQRQIQQDPVNTDLFPAPPQNKASSSMMPIFRNYTPIDRNSSLRTAYHGPRNTPDTVITEQSSWHTPVTNLTSSPTLTLPGSDSSPAASSITDIHPCLRMRPLLQQQTSTAAFNNGDLNSQSDTTLNGSPPSGTFDPHQERSAQAGTSPTAPTFVRAHPRSPYSISPPEVFSSTSNRRRSTSTPGFNSTNCPVRSVARILNNLSAVSSNGNQDTDTRNIRPAQSLTTLVHSAKPRQPRSDLREIRRIRAAQSADEVLPISRFANFRNDSFAYANKELPPLPPLIANDPDQGHDTTKMQSEDQPAPTPSSSQAPVNTRLAAAATHSSTYASPNTSSLIPTPISSNRDTSAPAESGGADPSSPGTVDFSPMLLTDSERKKLGARVRGLARERTRKSKLKSLGTGMGMGGGWW